MTSQYARIFAGPVVSDNGDGTWVVDLDDTGDPADYVDVPVGADVAVGEYVTVLEVNGVQVIVPGPGGSSTPPPPSQLLKNPTGAGGVFVPPHNSTTTRTFASLGSGFMTPVFIPEDVTITELGVFLTTVGTRTLRMGIWAADNDGLPGTLKLDSGAFAGSGSPSTIHKVTGLSLALTAGWYWYGVGTNGSSGTYSTVSTSSDHPNAAVFTTAPSNRALDINGSVMSTALGNNPGVNEANQSAPLFWQRHS